MGRRSQFTPAQKRDAVLAVLSKRKTGATSIIADWQVIFSRRRIGTPQCHGPLLSSQRPGGIMAILQSALLCDAAKDYQGKVSILGGFVGACYVNVTPGLALITLAARVGLEEDEMVESHQIRMRVLGPSGDTLADMQGELRIDLKTAVRIDGVRMGINIIQPIAVPFTDYGINQIEFHFDGQLLSSLPLSILPNSAA